MKWYLQVIRSYAKFNGRARRKEFWIFTIINFILSLLLNDVDLYFNILSGTTVNSPIDLKYVLALAMPTWSVTGVAEFGPIYFIYALALAIPTWSVTVRRLHDIGNSGWRALIALIPFVGGFILLILLLEDSHKDENIFGISPKYSRV